jgi:hypothetical protein
VIKPFKMLEEMLEHRLTDAGLKWFAEEWKKVPASAERLQREEKRWHKHQVPAIFLATMG